MIIGQTLQSDDSADGDIYFSPWFPRAGNKAVFSCEVIATADTTNGISTFTVHVQTKDAEDSDKTAINLLGTAQSISLTSDELITSFEAGAKLSDGTAQGMKELVRFQDNVKAQTSGHAWVHFRMLNPSWVSN